MIEKEAESKVEIEGQLFVLVEEDADEEKNTHICVEVSGLSIWQWFAQNRDRKVRIKLEILKDER